MGWCIFVAVLDILPVRLAEVVMQDTCNRIFPVPVWSYQTKTCKLVLAACPSRVSALMGGCIETVRTWFCHSLATSRPVFAGRVQGQCSPKVFCALPNFPENFDTVCFKQILTTKILPPKNIFCPSKP